MRWMRVGLVSVVVLLGGAAAIGPVNGQAQKQINVVGPPNAFSPPSGSIASGQTLLWENQTEEGHNATAAGEFSVDIPPGVGERSGVVTISGSPRPINYRCTIHGMTGTLQVTQGTGTAPPPPPPPPPPAGTTATTARPTVAGSRSTTTSRAGAATSTTEGFAVLAPTTTAETTSTTAGQVAINEDEGGGGTNVPVIVAVAIGIAALLGAGGYSLYRLGARGSS